MAHTTYIEMREGEQWRDVAIAFLTFCKQEKQIADGGCHEGDADPTPVVGKRYAAISIPHHRSYLIGLLREWALRERRTIKTL